jgi:hypothetical protein
MSVMHRELEHPVASGAHQPRRDAQQPLAQAGDALAPGQLEALAQPSQQVAGEQGEPVVA